MKQIFPSELRIGNLIEVPMFNKDSSFFTEKITEDFGYVIAKVNSFWISECEQKEGNWAGRPIILDDDFIKKLGFVKNSKDNSFYREDYTGISIRKKSIWYLYVNDNLATHGFKYVHELQNLYYCLTNIEIV